MRVISGISKGHKLKSLEGMNTRPTSDRLKETLFNIIAKDLIDCEFLDLFCGTGAIGIEALSRGAKKATFIDNSMDIKKIIDYNLNHTKLKQNAKVYTEDAIKAIYKLGNSNQKFDIIFMDPPYSKGLIYKSLEAIKIANISNGYIIAEHETDIDFEFLKDFKILKQKIYKKTTITFMEGL